MTSQQFYTVKAGDCLWTIAERFYHDGLKFPLILAANHRLIEDEDLIYPGQVFVIPALPERSTP